LRNRSKESPFLLSKWYLDGVSDEGDVFIGYAATLRWRALVIHYSSILQRQHNETTRVSTSLQKWSAPAVEGTSVHWSSRPLGVDGIWNAAAQPIELTLFESDAGSIEWRCVQPRARCQISFGADHRLSGLGYVEHLTMSIPPWRLPIDELRWGRFLSNSDALVWIDWRGVRSVTVAFRNGDHIENPLITDREVRLDGGRMGLRLEESQVLREGPLVRTALSVIPGIQKLLPIRTLRTYECKWLSRASLEEQGAQLCRGWAIHEIVRFY